MKSIPLALLSLLLAAPLAGNASERLIPAGSLVQCTLSEPKLSSKTTAVGDPILCQIGYSGYSAQLGRSVFPYDSYLVGQFEVYKDPGHFVGKGWMELEFDRMVIEPNTVLPIHAKVVGAPGYNVDRKGRILGKGHAVKDTVEWMIPILWPIDILNLPRRGPRPTLKAESRLTLKVMDDLAVPMTQEPQQDPSGLMHRAPTAYTAPPPEPEDSQPPAPVMPVYYPLAVQPPPPGYWYVAPPPPGAPIYWGPSAVVAPRRMPYRGPDNRQPVTLVFEDGRPPEQVYNYMMTPTTFYVLDRDRRAIPMGAIDLAETRSVNRAAGVDFNLPTGSGR